MEILELKNKQQKHIHSLDEFNSRTEMRQESVNLKTDQIPIEIPNMNQYQICTLKREKNEVGSTDYHRPGK